MDEELAGRLVGAVSFYFRRNHAPLGVLGHPLYDLPVVFFVRVRAILDVAVDAHVPLGRVEVRAAVLHDGAVDDNVVLAGCELLEAFVHATFDPATLWQYLRHGLLQRSCSGAPNFARRKHCPNAGCCCAHCAVMFVRCA